MEETTGILYLDAYIVLHRALLCVEYLYHRHKNEDVQEQLSDLGNTIDSYQTAIGERLTDDMEGNIAAQREEVNQDRELPDYLPRDSREIVYRMIGGYLMEAIGLLQRVPDDSMTEMVEQMRSTLHDLQHVHDALPRAVQEGQRGGKRRSGKRSHHALRRSRARLLRSKTRRHRRGTYKK